MGKLFIALIVIPPLLELTQTYILYLMYKKISNKININL